jgi:hypothetical protein
MEVLQLNVSKRRLNRSSSRSPKLRSRSINNNRRWSPGKLHLSSCNLRIINRRNSSLSSSRSVDNSSRRSPGKLYD